MKAAMPNNRYGANRQGGAFDEGQGASSPMDQREPGRKKYQLPKHNLPELQPRR